MLANSSVEYDNAIFLDIIKSSDEKWSTENLMFALKVFNVNKNSGIDRLEESQKFKAISIKFIAS